MHSEGPSSFFLFGALVCRKKNRVGFREGVAYNKGGLIGNQIKNKLKTKEINNILYKALIKRPNPNFLLLPPYAPLQQHWSEREWCGLHEREDRRRRKREREPFARVREKKISCDWESGNRERTRRVAGGRGFDRSSRRSLEIETRLRERGTVREENDER